MKTFMGIPIIINDRLTSTTQPKHVPKTDSARIRKKWLKKYGTVKVDQIMLIRMPRPAYVMSSANYAKLQSVVRGELLFGHSGLNIP